MDNLQEFHDPLNYDLEELPRSVNRIGFICKRALSNAGSTLDLACGTGIASLPVALLGLPVTGADLSGPMISHARHKARTLGVKAFFSVQDMRFFKSAMEFKFITLTGNAFQALLTQADQSMLLRVVARHLEGRGEFVFETRNPTGTDLGDSSCEESWFRYINATGQQVEVSGTQSYDASQQILTWTTYRRWADDTGPNVRRSVIACRFTAVQELDLLLRSAGLRVKERYGDWEGGPFTSSSEEIVTVCERGEAPTHLQGLPIDSIPRQDGI
jgi:SAM-dependent methyltransferase